MMCFALYIGTDSPLETSEWSESQRRFYLAPLSARDEVVRRHFSKPHVYYAGSHLQCGCGFFHNSLVFTDDPDMVRAYAESQESARALVEVIQRCLAASESVELFVTWEGRQGEPPERIRDMVPQQLLSPLVRHSDDADDEIREARAPVEEQDFIVFRREDLKLRELPTPCRSTMRHGHAPAAPRSVALQACFLNNRVMIPDGGRVSSRAAGAGWRAWEGGSLPGNSRRTGEDRRA